MIAGTCRYCLCAEATPCPRGCAWTDETRTLCTQCAGAENLAEVIVRVLSDTRPGIGAPVRLVTGAWSELTEAHKQLLVIATRKTLEQVYLVLEGELTDAAGEALEMQQELVDFLDAHVPEQELEPGESLSEMVMRLMRPVVERRIVTP